MSQAVRHNPPWTLVVPPLGIAILALSWAAPALPGLVLDWRHTASGWEAWVVTVETYSTGAGHASMVRQGWRAVAYLRPAGSVPPHPREWRAPGAGVTSAG